MEQQVEDNGQSLETPALLKEALARLSITMELLQDLTARKQAEVALRESEAFNQAVLNSLEAQIAVLDRNGTIIAVNEAWQRFARQNGGEEFLAKTGVGINYLEVCRRAQGAGAEGAQEALAGIQAVLAGASARFSLEYACHSPAEERWFLMYVSPLSSRQGGAVASHVTISQHKKIEAEKIRLYEEVSRQRQQLRALSQQVAEAQEAERKGLAREMHDRVGQSLTALDFNLNLIRAWLAELPGETGQIQAQLDDSLGLITEMSKTIQNVMADLRPPVLDDYGLVTALHWYSTRLTARTGLRISTYGEEPAPRLAASVENALFRIAQEALTNVAKHALARQVTVTLEVEGDTVRLVVTDDGAGFEPLQLESVERQGWGLLTMTERAEAVGGRCFIHSQSGQGTQVIVEVSR